MDGAGEAMAAAELAPQGYREACRSAMQAGSAYGSACVAMMATREAPLTEPLVLNRIRPGDLEGVARVRPLRHVRNQSREMDLFSPDFQQARRCIA